MSESELTRKSRDVITCWEEAKQLLETADRRAQSARCDLRNAETALGKHMCPAGALKGEKFCIWHGEKLFEVARAESPGFGDYVIKLRPGK